MPRLSLFLRRGIRLSFWGGEKGWLFFRQNGVVGRFRKGWGVLRCVEGNEDRISQPAY